MKETHHDASPERIDAHSLPGTNQAGKGAPDCDDTADQQAASPEDQHDEQVVIEHSLPGTNQAGKG